MAKFKIGARHFALRDARDAAYAWYVQGETLPDGAALAIAAKWMSPDGEGIGAPLIALASGGSVKYNDIADAIAMTRQRVAEEVFPLTGKPSPTGWGHSDVIELDALGEWLESINATIEGK